MKLFVLSVGLFALTCIIALLILRRERSCAAACGENVTSETMEQAGLRVPPKDYSAWMSEFGSGEPDPSTQEGRDRLRNEAIDFAKAENDLATLLKMFPAVLTNGTDKSEEVFVANVKHALGGFSRENRARLLKKVELNGEIDNFSMDACLKAIRSDTVFRLAIERYYYVGGQLADMIWRLGGDEFAAAEADRRTYFVLRKCKSSFPNENGSIAALLEKWKDERCDDEASNFCRSYQMCEDTYRRYFARAAERNPKILKAISSWYPRHLVWARSILGREPKWSPDFKK